MFLRQRRNGAAGFQTSGLIFPISGNTFGILADVAVLPLPDCTNAFPAVEVFKITVGSLVWSSRICTFHVFDTSKAPMPGVMP